MRAALPVLALACLVPACASVDVRAHAEGFRAGDVAGLRADLACLAEEDGGDAHLWLLQRGMLDLAAGEPAAGIAALRAARDRLDALRAAFYGQWIEAAFLDDRFLAYSGADYEHVLVRAVLALQDVVARGGDAFAYLNQMLQRQVEIRESFVTDAGERPKLRYKSAAVGNWLLAALEADNPTRADVVQRQLRAVLEHEPGCRLAQAELARFAGEGFAPSGCGVVQVVALVGLGPFRVPRDEIASSAVLHAAQVLWNARRGRATLPLQAIRMVQVPELALHPDNPTEAHVAADGRAATTETVTSVEALARAEFDAMRPQVVTRAVLRRLFKLVLNEAAKEATMQKPRPDETEQQRQVRERENQDRALLWDLVAAGAVALEAADLRCWSLLPASFQVARLVLPEGEHEVEIRAGRGGAPIGAAQRVRVRVHAGRSTFVVAQVPSLGFLPSPLTSDPAR